MKIKHLPIWMFKGATAYELQIGRLVVRFVHLRGSYYTWYRWVGRISIRWWPKEDPEDTN